ncbi:colanic acid biosynthesis glycosyltransferase WcaL [Novosphingobium endophyticum]|uniref:Colanic acid biosynthesis glycosyltransferase WcaL n=1 Tax=Novosphingobium endophyticum TaxID=1955250 RepID=A0A916TV08_9SPHN|nr:glycosyltransferase [Novosphingobium endophyticum]GGC12337.1 colanic acid biosynthesis glycosyltransferase WcaL [Novosphingobium endophyticum]
MVYLVRRFPVRSQTFVTNEILDHLRAGADIGVVAFGAKATADFPLEDVDPLIRPRVTYLDMPRESKARAMAILRLLMRRPRLLPLVPRAVFLVPTEGRHASLGVLLLALQLAETIGAADVVHCHFGNVGRLAALILRLGRWRAKLVTTFHGYDVSKEAYQPLGRYYAPLFGRGDLLLTVNSIWAERLRAAGADPARIRVHHMGIDSRVFEESRPHGAEHVRFCMVGRMVEKKGHAIALQALALLRKSRPELAIRLELVGDGPLQECLRAQARAGRLEDVAIFRGALSHRRALEAIKQADVFVLPSRTAADGDMEGIPVVLMEAMAMGKPVISTRHSGIPELVEDGTSGLLADENDASGIAAAMERLADKPDLGTRLGTAGRRVVLAEFNAVTQGERLRGLYASPPRERA